jgi:hypothetical protein
VSRHIFSYSITIDNVSQLEAEIKKLETKLLGHATAMQLPSPGITSYWSLIQTVESSILKSDTAE